MLEPTVETVSGRRIGILSFRATDFDIEDMARNLSNKCRFGGNLVEFYSVAEHSIHTAQVLWERYHREDLELAGLLHEVDEYVTTCDFPSPFKSGFTYMGVDMRQVSRLHQYEMCTALKEIYRCQTPLNVDILDAAELHEVDKLMCNTEKLQLCGRKVWGNLGVVSNVNIECWQPKTAYQKFLEYFNNLAYGSQKNTGTD